MPNRLANESSPYLRLHADNPVDWYPWGDEALARARAENKPILLSIGYASCHWCHVMAHESFEDAATAAFMNAHFVNVKVDREERPDIDAIYIDAAQAISGHAGWPLTAFLTPSQAPFFVGTYFPPEPRAGMPSFRQLLEGVAEAWRSQRQEIEAGREHLVAALSGTALLRPSDDVRPDRTLDEALVNLAQLHDPLHGGFGGAPKFPPHSVLDFLMSVDDEGYREIAHLTLRKMAAGGIFDQLAGGFARYSVDERWRVPHFEKMLYDNALLARNYLHAWQQTRESGFARVCRETLDWMLAEMRCEEGGFASALDADSPDEQGRLAEGAYYAWDCDEFAEVTQAAAPEFADDLLAYWGIDADGEFEGRNVLLVAAPERRPPDTAFAAARQALLDRRASRRRPARDDKRIASWNALAISALAEAGAALGEPRYLDAALRCAAFIERELRDESDRLRRTWLDGDRGPRGFLEDYAHVAAAYLTLYESCFDERWFVNARDTAELMIELFEDRDTGGFFTTSTEHDHLFVRRKDLDDSPTPSGNAAAALTLLRLSALTGQTTYRDAAERTLRLMAPLAARHPTSFGHALQAIGFLAAPVTEIALVGDNVSELADALRKDYRPFSVVAAGAGGDTEIPLLSGRKPLDGSTAAYVCRGFTCRRPVTSVSELKSELSATATPQFAE